LFTTVKILSPARTLRGKKRATRNCRERGERIIGTPHGGSERLVVQMRKTCLSRWRSWVGRSPGSDLDGFRRKEMSSTAGGKEAGTEID
jgi:hypothetical protein